MGNSKGINITFESGSEMVAYEIEKLMECSLEPEFTEYLKETLEVLKKDSLNSVALRKRVLANYKIYVKRMESLGESVEPKYLKVIYGEMDPPEVIPSGSPYSNDIFITNSFDPDASEKRESVQVYDKRADELSEADRLFEQWINAYDVTARIRVVNEFRNFHLDDPRVEYLNQFDEHGLMRNKNYEEVSAMIEQFFSDDRFCTYKTHERIRIDRSKGKHQRDMILLFIGIAALFFIILVAAFFS